jgi:hypothetical protein
MAENVFGCACGFKCVDSQLAKSEGACPKCGLRTVDNKAKFGKETKEVTQLHKTYGAR